MPPLVPFSPTALSISFFGGFIHLETQQISLMAFANHLYVLQLCPQVNFLQHEGICKMPGKCAQALFLSSGDSRWKQSFFVFSHKFHNNPALYGTSVPMQNQTFFHLSERSPHPHPPSP